MRQYRKCLIFIVFFLIIPVSLFARLYRCITDDGVPMFADYPCGDNAEVVTQRSLGIPFPVSLSDEEIEKAIPDDIRNFQDASDVFRKVHKSIVAIVTYDSTASSSGYGTGVVLPGGGVVTNCHIIDDAYRFSIFNLRSEYPAQLEYEDKNIDICVVKAGGFTAPSVSIGSSQELRSGSWVYAVNIPQRFEIKLSEGIISGFTDFEGDRIIRTTATTLTTSRGGGLFDQGGNLVGITSSSLLNDDPGITVPVEWVMELYNR